MHNLRPQLFLPLLLLSVSMLSAVPARAQAPTELFISEYVEGSSFNKALEIYNGTGSAIDLGLAGYDVQIFFNGNTSAGTTITLSGTVAPGATFVLADDGADAAVLAVTNQTSTANFFNGDDAVVLRKSGSIIDSIGQTGVDPGSQWGSGDTSTQDNTLRRRPEICQGDATDTDPFDPAVEWNGFPQNTFDGLGSHAVSCVNTPTIPDLLLSELVVTPTAAEFIEIYNPTGATLDLSKVFVTDATFAGGGTYYYNIVTGSNAGGGSFSDFHARFPAGATILPGEFQVLSLNGSINFNTSFGIDPDYELFEDDAVPDGVPDMVEALPGSINGQGGLTNSGEVVVLYYWDDESDLVVDLDYGLWGDKEEAIDKTGVSVDGPDPDTDPSDYLPDTAIPLQDVILDGSHASGQSFQRIDFSEGTETQSGGNGRDGSDETSENLSVTWELQAPTPGTAPDEPPADDTWIINEIHADPDTNNGDANGDGVVSTTQDEFVEIINNSGAPVDLSGWTISDGFGVRHTFPMGTTVPDQCGVVVFGGGTPTGLFGGMTAQTASSGTLGLNNGGDTITLKDGAMDVASVSYGGEGGNNQSLTRDPDLTGDFVQHTVAAGSGGTLFSPGTLVDGNPFGGCEIIIPTLEIFEIQGNGAASPVAGLTVTTLSNVVTAVGPEGFFMQTPTERSDGNVDTSDGIFVFEGAVPAVSVGDLVDVTGQVVEFFDFTEFGAGSAVTVVGSGSLPAPVIFDATVPSPEPSAPSCAIEFECYEGMLVEITSGAVTGPNQRFNSDPIAEVFITAAPERTFREPGIEFPGLPGLPVWDGNPEVFELDPDKLGLPNEIIPAGSTFSASGVLAFEFGDYELWPFELVVDEKMLPVPVRSRASDEFTIGSLNMFRFFDDIDDPADVGADGRVRDDDVVSTEEYLRRREKFVAYILEVLDAPDILAVQEVEKLGVLEDLAADIAALTDPSVIYTPYLIEGNDVGTIDIGFMVRDSITVDEVIQLGKDETFENPITMEQDILHDRPPLLLQGRHLDQTLVQVMGVHMRSLSGIDGSQGERVRQKRYEQANSVAEKVQLLQDLDPLAPVLVVGDFNGFEFTDGYVDLVGQIGGNFEPEDNLVCDTNPCPDLVDPDLDNPLLDLPMEERYSFIFRGNGQALDHVLTSAATRPFFRGLEFGRGNADAAVDLINDGSTALRSSDHDGWVLYLLADGDLDGVPDAEDFCPETMIPESVPTVRLGVNRWALVDEDFTFDTALPPGQRRLGLPTFSTKSGRRPAPFTTQQTAGCSCEQIIDELGLGQGHVKFGCSTGVMFTWIDIVTP